jgi:hypothetical protein
MSPYVREGGPNAPKSAPFESSLSDFLHRSCSGGERFVKSGSKGGH